MNTQLWASSNSFVVAMYYRIYFQVGMANEFLRQTSEEEAEPAWRKAGRSREQIQQYRAEARFLRALSLWHGVDLFGNIPLVTEAVLLEPPRRRPRTPGPRKSTTSSSPS